MEGLTRPGAVAAAPSATRAPHAPLGDQSPPKPRGSGWEKQELGLAAEDSAREPLAGLGCAVHPDPSVHGELCWNRSLDIATSHHFLLKKLVPRAHGTTPPSRRTKSSGQKLLACNVHFPVFPDEQQHWRQAAPHKWVQLQEKHLPHLYLPLVEEEMGPKHSPSPEGLVGTSLSEALGVLPLHTPALLGHHTSSLHSFTAPLPSGFGFAAQQNTVAVQVHGPRPQGLRRRLCLENGMAKSWRALR